MEPSVESEVKSGAMSPRRIAMVFESFGGGNSEMPASEGKGYPIAGRIV
jgi:hypothetical protein